MRIYIATYCVGFCKTLANSKIILASRIFLTTSLASWTIVMQIWIHGTG